MKHILLILCVVSGIGLLYLQGCSTPADSENAVVIAGEVLEKSSGNAIKQAIVLITSPEEHVQETITDSTGFFSFTVEVENSTDISLQIDKQGYTAQNKTFKIAPGVDENDLVVEMVSESDSGGDTGEGSSDEVGGDPEGAAAIVLQSVSEQAINIKETGDVVSTAFTFQVQDSAGRALNSAGAVDVEFSIVSGPGGGEEIIPATARTNAQGQVTTSLFSGNAAGPVKIQALIERPEAGITIQSKPVLVAIHGGFPDYNHFSIAPKMYNFEGFSFNNLVNKITVIVGDKFSNPVKPGTVVYFETTGGVVQGSGTTNEMGVVTVDLLSGDPRPADGFASVTATTVNAEDERISKSIDVIFSTSDAVIDANPKTFDLQPNGGESFTYTVTDLNGNPMAAGTTITVEGGDGIEVTGDTDITLGNSLQGRTNFSFSIRDTDEETADAADLTLKISVTTPNGNTTTYSGISGTRRKTMD